MKFDWASAFYETLNVIASAMAIVGIICIAIGIGKALASMDAFTVVWVVLGIFLLVIFIVSGWRNA